MEAPKKLEKLEEEKDAKINFDFTKKELEYIIENANFTEEQEKIFKMLTGRQRQTVNSKYINKNEYVRKYSKAKNKTN